VCFGAHAHEASPCGVWVLASPLAAALRWGLTGHGDSDWGAGPEDYEMDSLVAYLVSIVTAIGEKPVAIGACWAV
jgi:hypothetical protein